MIDTWMITSVTGVCFLSGGVFLGAWWATRGRDEYVERLKRRIEQLKVVNSAMYQMQSGVTAKAAALSPCGLSPEDGSQAKPTAANAAVTA